MKDTSMTNRTYLAMFCCCDPWFGKKTVVPAFSWTNSFFSLGTAGMLVFKFCCGPPLQMVFSQVVRNWLSKQNVTTEKCIDLIHGLFHVSQRCRPVFSIRSLQTNQHLQHAMFRRVFVAERSWWWKHVKTQWWEKNVLAWSIVMLNIWKGGTFAL